MAEDNITPSVSNSNYGEIKTDPLFSVDAASKALDISQSLGINVNPVVNFKPKNNMEVEIAPDATATRSVANESDESASLIKPDAKSLSILEKYNENYQIQMKTADLNDQNSAQIIKQIDLRKKGKELSEDELIELDARELQIEDLEQRRKGFDLNMAEKVITGDLPSVFRDMVVGAKENPVIASLGLLGFVGGPALGRTTLSLSTSGASAQYNYDRTLAKTYRDLEQYKDSQGNALPEDLKLGISRVSAGTQASLEFASDVVLKKMSKLWNGPKIAGRIAEKALNNPTFRNKLVDLATRSGVAAMTEGVTEVLQDMAGDFAESTGATWSKKTGVDINSAATKFGTDFDSGKYSETFVRSALTGAGAVGVQDSGRYAIRGTLGQGKKLYNFLTGGKNIKLGPNDSVTVEESAKTFDSVDPKKGPKFNLPATPEQIAEQEQAPTPKGPYIIKDGVPTYLTPQEAIVLGHIMPNIESIRGYNIGENAIATELLQTREAEKNGINQVFIDKEKLNEWADTSEKKQAVAKLFVGERGAYLDAQKVPLTREEYYKLHSFGNTEFLTDSTAITSTGMTMGDLRQLVKEKAPKDIPKADNIPASAEQNTAGEVNLSTEGELPATSNLGVQSSIEEVTSTLKTKEEADAYLGRLKAEETSSTTFNGKDGQTYTIQEVTNKGMGYTDIQAVDANGKVVGSVNGIYKTKDGQGRINEPSVDVNEENQRQGVASALYDYAESQGYLIPPVDNESSLRTEQGKAFREARGEGNPSRFERLAHIKEMQDRVNAIKNDLPNYTPPPPEVDVAIKDFENFGDVTENVFAAMSPSEQAQYTEEVTKAKTDMKRNFKSEIIQEYDQVASLTERELNNASQDETINNIMNDENITIVEAFMGDKSLKIDPETLSSNQKEQYLNNPDDQNLLQDRKAFKKSGMHVDEVAAQMGITSDKLLEAIAYSPTMKQAYETKTKLEEARNKKIAADNTGINKPAIDATIDNVIGLKKKMLSNILKTDPKAGLRLLHSIFKAGSKTNIESVNINAQETTDNTRIGNLKPSSYLNASRRHMNRANTAINKDLDLSRGAANIEKSMIADELFKASTKTISNVNQILSQVSNMNRNRGLMDKLRSTGHYESFQALLSMLGQRKTTAKDLNVVKDMMIEWQDKGLEADNKLPSNIVQPIASAIEDNTTVDINNLSLSQIETIKSVIDQVLADSKNEITQRKQQQTLFDKDIGAVAEKDVATNPYRDGSKSKTYAQGGSGWYKQYLTKLSGFYSAFQSNDDILTWYKIPKDSIVGLMWRQVKGLGIFDNGMGEKGKFELTNKVKNYMDSSIGKENQKRVEGYAGKYVAVPEWQNSNGLLTTDGKIRYTDLLGMLMVYGSQDGANRLSKYGIDVKGIPAILYKYLHKDDIQVAKALGKTHDFLKPGIEHVEKTLRGVNKVEFVEGNKFMWGDEEVDGWYVHFSYKAEQKVDTQAKRDQKEIERVIGQDKAFNDNDAARGFTKEGFKKARANNVDALINLDINTMIDKSLGAIIANNTMLVPIYNSMRILNNPKVAEQFINVMGSEGYKIFKSNILITGRNSNFDVHQTIDSFSWLGRKLRAAGDNYMASKIIGSISSVLNQFLTFGLIVNEHIDKNPKIIGMSAYYMIKMMVNPKSVNTLIDQMSDHIPAIKTDKTSYQVDNVQSFKLFDKSESENGFKRAVVNGSDAMTELWLSKIMGGLDTFNKTAYATAVLNAALDGNSKGGPTKKQIETMSETELLREAHAHTDEMVAKMFPDRRLSSSSYVQTHPVARAMVPFFNDARRAMNAVYFTRMKDMVEAVTMFPKNAAKNGVASALLKSTKDISFNAIALHVYASMIDATIRGLRGEDDEGDKTGSENYFKRWFKIFKKDFMDRYMVLKGTADVMPVVSSVKFFFETDGRGGGITTPLYAYLESFVKTGKNLYDIKFNDEEWTEAKSRDLVNAISGITPIPASPINNYIFGESTAFKTGLKTAIGVGGLVMQSVPEQFKDIADRVVDLNPEAKAAPANPDVVEVDASEREELMRTLLTEPAGRSTLASYIEDNQIPIMSQDEVYGLIFTESNGDPNARNGHSGATGVGQFVTKTWNNLKNKHPHELQDITEAYRYPEDVPDGETDGRLDVAQSMVMLERLHKDIAVSLVRNGIEPTQNNIYIGHHFGQLAAVDFIKAKDSQKVKAVYGDDEAWEKIQYQNPWIRNNMTVGQFKDHIETLLLIGADKQRRWEEQNGPFDPFNLPVQ